MCVKYHVCEISCVYEISKREEREARCEGGGGRDPIITRIGEPHMSIDFALDFSFPNNQPMKFYVRNFLHVFLASR